MKCAQGVVGFQIMSLVPFTMYVCGPVQLFMQLEDTVRVVGGPHWRSWPLCASRDLYSAIFVSGNDVIL